MKNTQNPTFIILAAGKGTRMKSTRPKVLHPVGNTSMLAHVLKTANSFTPENLVVVTECGAEAVETETTATAPNATCIRQGDPQGTGHAVKQALPALKGVKGTVIVLYGDAPLITPEDITALLTAHTDNKNAITILSAETDTPHGLGRIIRTDDGTLTGITEEKDCTEEERHITEINTGIYAIAAEHLAPLVNAITNTNAQQEYYLTDIISLARTQNLAVDAVMADTAETLIGANDRVQLADMEWHFQQRMREAFMLNGVTLIDPATTYFSADTQIAPDTTIEPNCFFGKGVTIKTGALIKANSYLEGCTVGENSTVGPFARLRPGAILAEDTKVGNFVEIKNATLGAGSKASHLTYVGDATVGDNVNIGAGTIFANYHSARKQKNQTTVGHNASLGANSVLVAPTQIGDGAFVAASTTVRKHVPNNALAADKPTQVVKENYIKKDK